MKRPPLLYSSDGVNALVAADDTQDQLLAAAVVAFGALTGVHRVRGQGASLLTGEALERYQAYAANKIVDAVGYEILEQALGIRIQRPGLG